MTDQSKRDELLRLADNVADAILDMGDDEVLAELDAEGVSAADAGKAFDSQLDSARMKVGRMELAKAREEMEADRRATSKSRTYTANEARELVSRLATKIPHMTQAARNAKSGELSDSEVFDLLDDLRELGVELEGANDA